MQFRFGQVSRAVSCREVAMFHGGAAELSAMRTGVLVIIFLGVLTLHDLVEFGGEHLAEFVTVILDLRESGLNRGSAFAVDFAAHQATEFLHLGKNLR